MDNYCCRCGETSDNKDITLFGIPCSNNLQWYTGFIKCLGIQEDDLTDIKICSKHFNPDDLKLKNGKIQLRKNALPIDIEMEEQQTVTKVANLHRNCDSQRVDEYELEATGEIKLFAPLEPLIEYVYEGKEEKEEEYEEYSVQEMVQAEMVEVDSNSLVVQSEEDGEGNEPQVISVVKSEASDLKIEPMMPFFLTSSPVFTVLNEQDEGETIILQIDDAEEKKELLPNANNSLLYYDIQWLLCSSKENSNTDQFVCDICNTILGCLNCLKSHYKTLHIESRIMRYKCESALYPSKNLICPVCELMFSSKNDMMTHYLTHAVICDICNTGFNRQALLRDHYKTEHNREYVEASHECGLCGTTYQYPASLSRHYHAFHKMILCSICRIKFDSVGALHKHEQTHYQQLKVLPYACSKCDKAFAKISDIAVHIRLEHKKDSDSVYGFNKTLSKDMEMPRKKKVKVK